MEASQHQTEPAAPPTEHSLRRDLMLAERRLRHLQQSIHQLEQRLELRRADPEMPVLDAGITVRRIVHATAAAYGVDVISVLRGGRSQRIARPRQCIMWLARRHTTQSLPQIARTLGLDHSTVLHGVARHAERMELEPDAEAITRQIERSLIAAPQHRGKFEPQEAFNGG